MSRRILLAAAVLAALLPCAASGAQEHARGEPGRPRLPAAADTNSAAAYYAHGVDVMRSRPSEAEDALYWATRLDPGMAEAWYARRIAYFMVRPDRFGAYLQGNRRTIQSREMRAVDSLQLRALMLNPFLRTRFEKTLFDHYVDWVLRKNISSGAVQGEVLYWVESGLRQGSPANRAWVSHAEGRFPEALAAYASALRQTRDRAGIRASRSRIFMLVGRPDSALAEMERAVREQRRRSEREKIYLYESGALFEHSAGVILEQQGNPGGAREAYGRALREDPSYYPAHVALASLAVASGDTATALAELDRAVQVREDEPTVRYAYARLLALAGRYGDAVAHLRRAVEVEPFYAAPYALLGGMLETQGKHAEALEQYRAFLARASRDHPLLGSVRTRVAALGPEATP